ncbi:MAG: hypothetical protein WAK93_11825 [Solirubrobacteraceae bacterium]
MGRAVSVATPAGSQALDLPISRRALILAGGGALSGLMALRGAGFLERAVSAPGHLGLRRSDYAPYVGRGFRLSAGAAGALTAPLVAVHDVSGARGLAGSEDAFILVFRAARGARDLGQAMMTVRHPRGWSRRLLVSPASPAHNGLDYAAVINRVRVN